MKNILRHFSWLTVTFYIAVLGLTAGASAQSIAHQIALPTGASWCDDSMINGLFGQINTFRATNLVPALTMDTLGMKDAEVRATQFAAYMAGNSTSTPGFNPHQGYDTTAAGLGYRIISENLAYMTTNPNYVVNVAWQDSLHIAAMVARDANVAGVSCIYFNAVAYWSYEPGCSPSFCGQSFPISSLPTPPPPTTTTSTTTTSTTPVLDTEEANFLTLINNYRAQNGAGPLQVSLALENSSTWMSNDMATKNYASHSDSLGRSPGARLAAFNYPYTPWGENIAGGYGDAQNALNQWISACDPDGSGACTYAHKQNMLNPSFVVIGIGRAYGSSSTYGWYWTTDFGGVLDQTISSNPNPNPPPTSAPSITGFTATPSAITAGQGSSLAWSVSGATGLSVDNGVGSVTGLTSKSVTPAQTTTYTLTATNTAGSVTARVTVTVNPAADTQAPSAPVLTSAVGKSPTEVDLTWAASSDNVGVTGYQIIRNGVVLTSVSGGTLGYADASAMANVSYGYTIKAFDAAKNYSTAGNAIQVTTAAAAGPTTPPTTPTPASNCPAPATNAFTGCYYNNTGLTGNPAFVRTDSQINFNWYWAPPDPSVTGSSFSARWQGNFNFDGGNYTFTAITSDGMRIYIDGVPILDRWRDQTPTMYTLRPNISQGSHLVVVEYYEETRTGTASVTWQSNSSPSATMPSIAGFTATPSVITAGQGSSLAWNVSGATSLSVDNGVGSVTGLTSKSATPAQTTTYTLTATNTAGSVTARVTLTVNPAADTQAPSAPVLISAVGKSPTEVDLTWAASSDNVGVTGYQIIRNGVALTAVAGGTLAYADTSTMASASYSYTVKAFDAAKNYSSASNAIQVTTAAATSPTTPPTPPTASNCPAPAANAFTGCYYNNTGLTGTPAFTRTDSQINFNWYWAPPAPSVTGSSFSARWQGNFNFDGGNYTFTAITSDGMRIYIDGVPILDRWRDQAPTMYTLRPNISQGSHLVVVEYYEESRTGTASVVWRKN